MEEAKSARRKASKREPFIELSNVIPSSLRSSQSSSSLIKPQIRSSLSLPLKSLPDNPNSKFTATESTTYNNSNDKKKKKEKEKSSSKKANPSSTLSPSPNTPSISVYGRHTAEKRKRKGKEIAEPLSCSFETRMQDLRKKKDEDGDIGISKSCPMRCKKKQHRVKAEIDASEHDLPQDFIDMQRAYFAEVDAFELEEEVASADELDYMRS